MKISYISKNFADVTLEVIRQANDIIEDYRKDGLDLTARQLYYQFVSTGEDNMANLNFPLVDGSHNNEKSYKRVCKIVSEARLAGLIAWDIIKDRTREKKGNSHWQDPGQIVRAAARSFMLDHWENQPHRVEVWIEKDALIGVIESVCESLDVDYFACKGYVSQSEMWDASQRLEKYKKDGQHPVIIHLGDHDPSGIDMTRDITDRQELFMGGVIMDRIALNMDQVTKHKPPPNPTKLKDSRSSDYIRKFGRSCWELDALEPRILQRLVKNAVEFYRDEDLYEETMDREKEYMDILARVEANWQTL